LHHFLPPRATVPSLFITPFAKRLEEETAGALKIDVFPAMQLGGTPPQLFDQAKDGVVDIVWTLPSYTPGRFPKLEALDLPFIAGLAEPTSRAAHMFYERHLKDEFAQVQVLAIHSHGPGLLHMTGDGVRRLEDVVGKRLRIPSRMLHKYVTSLGGAPVGMPVPQVPEALANRVIDGTVLPWEVTASLKIAELTRTHTGFSGNRGLYTTGFVFAMNKARYESLPADLRAVLDRNTGLPMAAAVGRVMDDGDQPALEMARRRGNTLLTLDADETRRWKERASVIRREWIADMQGKGIDGAALVSELEDIIARQAGPASG
jgi:TRAP-type C4-dicarboxylate transport system substrate-binding protein